MTVYVALPLPETFRVEVSARLAAIKKLNQEYHWLDTEELHVTTNFYGGIDAVGAGLVQSAVTLAAAGFGPFTMSVDSIGINWDLVHRSDKKVAAPWEALFVDKGKEKMAALADNINAALAEISRNSRCVFRDRIKRPLKPYITILRMGRPRETIALLGGDGKLFSGNPFKPAPKCLVREAVVYVSCKLPDGARRTTRTTVGLG